MRLGTRSEKRVRYFWQSAEDKMMGLDEETLRRNIKDIKFKLALASKILETREAGAALADPSRSRGEPSTKARIVLPPGHHISEWLRFAIPKKSFDRIFSQIILDFRQEYLEALAVGQIWRARFRHLQLWGAVVVAALLWLGTSTARRVVDLWKIG